MKYDIFISYSRKDLDVIQTVYNRLVAEGFNVWIDRQGLYSGDQFKREITKAIINSRVLIYFSSEHANKSSWTASEIGVAREFHIPIMPVRLDNTPYSEEVLLDLVNLNFTDFSVESQRPQRLEELVRSLLRFYPPSKEKEPADEPVQPQAPVQELAPAPTPAVSLQPLIDEFSETYLSLCNRYPLIPRTVREAGDVAAVVRDICRCGAIGIPSRFPEMSLKEQVDILETFYRDDEVRLALATGLEVRLAAEGNYRS